MVTNIAVYERLGLSIDVLFSLQDYVFKMLVFYIEQNLLLTARQPFDKLAKTILNCYPYLYFLWKIFCVCNGF